MSSRNRVGFSDDAIRYMRAPRRHTHEHEDDIDIDVRESRTPVFLKDDRHANPDTAALVLRSRVRESVDRIPSHRPERGREARATRRSRSLTPPPAPPYENPPRERLHARIVARSPSISRVRRLSRSPSPPGRDRVRVMDRMRERVSSSSSSPSESSRSPSREPRPAVIRAPTVERDVITHYRGIDHGIVHAHPPPRPHAHPSPKPRTRSVSRPRPAPPRPGSDECDLDVDIDVKKHKVSIDVRERHRRSQSRERVSPPEYYNKDKDKDKDKGKGKDKSGPSSSNNELTVRARHHSRSRGPAPRRAQSAALATTPGIDSEDEADYITSRIGSRGTMGEAYHGVTKGWTIVDIPPGTQRVTMDGVGGAAAEVTWQRYNGARRAKFIPDPDHTSRASSHSPVRQALLPQPRGSETELVLRDELSVHIYDDDDDKRRSLERDIHISHREPAPPAPKREVCTELAKDLVLRNAIEHFGYDYEESEDFFYVTKYLRYDDVLELVEFSDDIRHGRRKRLREVDEWEREHRHRDHEHRHRDHEHCHRDHEHCHWDHEHRCHRDHEHCHWDHEHRCHWDHEHCHRNHEHRYHTAAAAATSYLPPPPSRHDHPSYEHEFESEIIYDRARGRGTRE